MAVAFAPPVPDCLLQFAHALRPVMAIQRITFDYASRWVYIILQHDRDDAISEQVLAQQRECIEHWPDLEPVVRFDIINLADFPDEEQPQLLEKYRGTLALLP